MPTSGQDALDRLRQVAAATARAAVERPRNGVRHDDADDVLGTAATDDAVAFDPLPLLVALDQAGAEAVVIGQVAGILHGSTEGTGDLDLLWDGSAAAAPAMARAFASVGASLTDDEGRPVPCAAASFLLPKVLFRSPTACGDCCTPALPWRALPVRDFLARAVSLRTEQGQVIRYLARDDLLAMRRAAGRPKDLRRVTAMLEGQV